MAEQQKRRVVRTIAALLIAVGFMLLAWRAMPQ